MDAPSPNHLPPAAAGVRHRLLQAGGALGALTALYLFLQPWLALNDYLCSASPRLACGVTAYALGLPWLGPLNALAGLGVSLFFVYCGFRLPRLAVQRESLRRWLLILATAGLGYAIFLRALELLWLNAICPWCTLLTGCVAAAAAGAWAEWAHYRAGADRSDPADRAFYARSFYGDMLKLTLVFVLVSFGGVCSTRGWLPRPRDAIVPTLLEAGFEELTTVRERLEREPQPHLMFLYSSTCPHCLVMTRTLNSPLVKAAGGAVPKIGYNVRKDPSPLKQYQLEGVPCLLVFDGQGKVVMNFPGVWSARELAKGLERSLKASRRPPPLLGAPPELERPGGPR